MNFSHALEFFFHKMHSVAIVSDKPHEWKIVKRTAQSFTEQRLEALKLY
jgi:hypothetical protein